MTILKLLIALVLPATFAKALDAEVPLQSTALICKFFYKSQTRQFELKYSCDNNSLICSLTEKYETGLIDYPLIEVQSVKQSNPSQARFIDLAVYDNQAVSYHTGTTMIKPSTSSLEVSYSSLRISSHGSNVNGIPAKEDIALLCELKGSSL